MDIEAELIEKICRNMGVVAPAYGGVGPVRGAAYAYDMNAIFVSRDLFDALSDLEAEFALAHEVGHAATRRQLSALLVYTVGGRWLLAMTLAVLGGAVLFCGAPSLWLAVPLMLGPLHVASCRYWRFGYCEQIADQFALKHIGSAALALRLFTKVITKGDVTPDKYLRRRLQRLQQQALREMPELALLPNYLKF